MPAAPALKRNGDSAGYFIPANLLIQSAAEHAEIAHVLARPPLARWRVFQPGQVVIEALVRLRVHVSHVTRHPGIARSMSCLNLSRNKSA